MSYYRSEENVYCTSKKLTATAGQDVDNISIQAKGPCKIDSIIAKFADETSGDFTVQLTRNNITVDLLKVTLDSNKEVIATDVNVWIPNAGNDSYQDSKLKIINETTENVDVIIDYAY